jgi:hypothetical protein
MADGIKLVYTGSKVEGLFIKDLLIEDKIGCIAKDAFQSSIQAGWTDGLPEDGMQIYVEEGFFNAADELIKGYFTQRDKENS